MGTVEHITDSGITVAMGIQPALLTLTYVTWVVAASLDIDHENKV